MPLLDLFIDCSEAAEPGVVVQRGRNLHICMQVCSAGIFTHMGRATGVAG